MLCSFIGLLLKAKIKKNPYLIEDAKDFLDKARDIGELISEPEEKHKWLVRVPTGQESTMSTKAMLDEL